MFGRCRGIIYIIIIVILMIAGRNSYKLFYEEDTKEEEERVMPDIVFMNVIDYTQLAQEDETQYAITFYDKYGNHYTSKDPEVYGLRYDELVRKYAAKELDDKITFHATCDLEELYENYQKLCEVSKNDDYEIIYPEVELCVQAYVTTWYGIYYDEKNELQSLVLHVKNAEGNHDANDQRANEIYNWYIGTLKK